MNIPLTAPLRAYARSKPLRPFVLAAALVVLSACNTAPTATGGAPVAATSTDPWERSGQESLNQALTRRQAGVRARNVILFVGDGMSVDTVTAARIYAGQQLGGSGEEHVLSFERFAATGLIKTYNTNLQTPDSAGTATAMLTGRKTKAGVIGVSEAVVRGDCASVPGTELESLIARAEKSGLATGIVTTTRITHATPAAAYAHSADRYWEFDKSLPADASGCPDIARQLVAFSAGDGIDVILGGGRAMFLPDTLADPEDEAQQGLRGDGRNLVSEWEARYPGTGQFIWNSAQFDAWQPAAGAKLLGLFERSHLNFELDRAGDTAGEPSLSEMTAKALQSLQKQPGPGYLLYVEGGRIDHAHHRGNAARALADAVEFAAAIGVARSLTETADTLIVVTADHAHALAMMGYATRGNPILGKVRENKPNGEPAGSIALDTRGRPFTTVLYTGGQGATQDPDLTEINTEAPDYQQRALIPLPTASHSPTDVAIYADGPAADLLVGVHEQHYIYHVMRYALGL